ncbi:MAG: preprotein translocase subunit SecA [Deltaproteobacteria bacterium RIFCSPLOWO2_02_FULL_46_8]|nr:MAG: preprotein translocase subunit SecA [Deltaproteobacteria bacterium RIFCSPLOWO2_02_FULL_46_8]
MRIGWTEIIVILALILLLFGAKRLPDLARSLGQSLKEFKKGTKGLMSDDNESDKSDENDKKKSGKDK